MRLQQDKIRVRPNPLKCNAGATAIIWYQICLMNFSIFNDETIYCCKFRWSLKFIDKWHDPISIYWIPAPYRDTSIFQFLFHEFGNSAVSNTHFRYFNGQILILSPNSAHSVQASEQLNLGFCTCGEKWLNDSIRKLILKIYWNQIETCGCIQGTIRNWVKTAMRNNAWGFCY